MDPDELVTVIFSFAVFLVFIAIFRSVVSGGDIGAIVDLVSSLAVPFMVVLLIFYAIIVIWQNT